MNVVIASSDLRATLQLQSGLTEYAVTHFDNAETMLLEIGALLAPITKEVDAAVNKVAKAQGFVLVMDRAIASSSGLVIYADQDGTDLTDEVIAEVKK